MVFQKVCTTFTHPISLMSVCLTFLSTKVFDVDIRNLLSMSDMWRSRAPPLPLDFDAIRSDTFVLREQPASQPSAVSNGSSKGSNGKTTNGANGSKSTEKLLNGASAPAPPAAGLKDQRSLTLSDNLALFVSRYAFSCSSGVPD